MKTIRFEEADVFSWESTHDDYIQEAMDDSSDIAIIVTKAIDTAQSKMKEQYAGDVHGAMGPVGMYIYTMDIRSPLYLRDRVPMFSIQA